MLALVDGFLGAKDAASRRHLLILHLNLLSYSMAFWLQQPVLPALSKSVGGSDVDFGTLQSLVALLGLLGAPLLGRIVDTQGSRLALIISQTGSGLSYLLVANATSFNSLLLAALPSAMSHGMLASQAAVAALSPESETSVALGRLGLSYGAGMIIGSSAGGLVSNRLYLQAAPLLASALSLLCALLLFLLLPPLAVASGFNKRSGFDLLAVVRVASQHSVRPVLLTLLASGMAVGVFRAMMSMALHEAGFSTEDLGFFIGINAAVGLITNVFLIAPLTKRLGGDERRVLLLSSSGSCLTFVVLALDSNRVFLPPIALVATLFSTLLYTTSTGVLSKCVPKEEAGTAISIGHALRALTGILAPVVGGYALQTGGFPGVSWVSSIFAFIGAGIQFTVLLVLSEPSASAPLVTRAVERALEEKTHTQ